MPNAFDFGASPFDCLSSDERQLVRDHVDIAYFREGQALLEPGVEPSCLFVVIKGHVAHHEGDELVATLGPQDVFDGRALVTGRVVGRFSAAEEVLAYQLERATVTELIARNATFGALLFSDLSKKLSALAQRHSQHEMQSLTMARVDEALVRKPRTVGGATSIVDVVRVFTGERTDHVLVHDDSTTPARLGIFTTTGLQRAILHGAPLAELPVRELATFGLVTTAPGAYLFEALATMIRHKVRRLVVAHPAAPGQPAQPVPERIVGTLDQLDVLSFLSNHSYLITRQILDAQDLPALAPAAQQITRLIGLLHRGGTKVSLIAHLVQELNAKLFERAWQLIAPAELVAHSCLFVMGSEGRGEQLLRTDQDNGLVLRDGYTPPADLPALCERFSQALASFGYPECPGGIMVRNPQWRGSVAEFANTARGWLLQPSADSLMALAIFIDAHAVAGDATLLEAVREQLYTLATDNQGLLARFASAVNAFESGSGWWNRLFSLAEGDRQQLDLKKAGIFPLVHGVRAMALEHRVPATSTVARIQALVLAHKLPPDLADELVDTLHFLIGLKLQAGLDALDMGREPGRGVDVAALSPLQRDLLKDALGVVKRFKALLEHRYRLDTL